MPHLLMIIGEPAAGKSSLVKALTGELPYSIEKKPFWHTIYYDDHNEEVGAQLGWVPEFGDGKDFAGTDRLPYDVINRATKWLKDFPHEYILVEGDRLTNERFIDAAISYGYAVELVVVEADDVTFEERRKQRSQSHVWVGTRLAKVRNLLDEYQPWVTDRVSGTIEHAQQLAQLYRASAVVRQFMEAQIDRPTGVPSPDQNPE